jgi:FtsH-binding integral membrane protein
MFQSLFKKAVLIYCVFLALALIALTAMVFGTTTSSKGAAFFIGFYGYMLLNLASLLVYTFAKNKHTAGIKLLGFIGLILTAVVTVSSGVYAYEQGFATETFMLCLLPFGSGAVTVWELFGSLGNTILRKKETTA